MRYFLMPLSLSLVVALAIISCNTDTGMNQMNMNAGSYTTTPLAKAIDFDAIYVVNGESHSISVINAATNQVAGTIAMNNVTFPHHVSLSPDGLKLSLGVPGQDFSMGHMGGMMDAMGAVMVLDAKTGALIKAKSIMSMNHNAAFDPTGNEIWTCGMMTAGMLYIMNGTSLAITDSIAVGNTPQEVSFAPGGRYAFVCNGGSHNVMVIDHMTKQLVKTIDVGTNPVGAWPGSNGMMYVDNEDSKTVSAIDTGTLTVTRTYNLGFTPGMVACGPNRELWITNEDSGSVVINSVDKDSVIARCATGAGAHGIVFNADASKAYVTNQLAHTVSVIDASTKQVVTTIQVGQKPNGLCFRKN